jgi:hypothetical protein
MSDHEVPREMVERLICQIGLEPLRVQRISFACEPDGMRVRALLLDVTDDGQPQLTGGTFAPPAVKTYHWDRYFPFTPALTDREEA